MTRRGRRVGQDKGRKGKEAKNRKRTKAETELMVAATTAKTAIADFMVKDW